MEFSLQAALGPNPKRRRWELSLQAALIQCRLKPELRTSLHGVQALACPTTPDIEFVSYYLSARLLTGSKIEIGREPHGA